MNQSEVYKILGKLLKLAPSRRSDKSAGEAQESTATEDKAQSDPAENELYSLLRDIPSSTDDKRMLTVSREQVKDRGEDSFLAAIEGQNVFLGVFDGCGGSGGKTYASFGGHTGAWVASRTAAIAAREWFLSTSPENGQAKPDLATVLNDALQACKSCGPAGQVLLGSLSKEFPTTVAAFRKQVDSDLVDLYWCGDSRCFCLDADGLHQLTADDSAIQDAMRNLREDAPMTNVVSASHPFQLHERHLKISRPSLLFAATDGCFGYLPSPMAFERLLLETMERSSSMEEWKRRLDARIGSVSGDDYTLTAWLYGFASFKDMKRTLRDRLVFLTKHYPAVRTEEALFAQWNEYKTSYERMIVGAEADPERGKQ